MLYRIRDASNYLVAYNLYLYKYLGPNDKKVFDTEQVRNILQDNYNKTNDQLYGRLFALEVEPEDVERNDAILISTMLESQQWSLISSILPCRVLDIILNNKNLKDNVRFDIIQGYTSIRFEDITKMSTDDIIKSYVKFKEWLENENLIKYLMRREMIYDHNIKTFSEFTNKYISVKKKKSTDEVVRYLAFNNELSILEMLDMISVKYRYIISV